MPYLALRPQAGVLFGHAFTLDKVQWALSNTSPQSLTPNKVFMLAQSAHKGLLAHRTDLGPQNVKEQMALWMSGAQALTPLQSSKTHPGQLFYKREDLTAIGAYKIRGAFNAMHQAMQQGQNRFVAASTGNHALGVLLAAKILKPEYIEMVIPKNTHPQKVAKIETALKSLKSAGVQANLKKVGESFDEAQQFAKTQQAVNRVHFLAPYSDTHVIAGQATVGLEIAEQLTSHLKNNPQVNELTVAIPIGGGGLSRGIVAAMSEKMSRYNQLNPKNPIKTHFIGLQLADPANQTKAGAIKVLQADGDNLLALQAMGVQIIKLDDQEVMEGTQFLNKDLGIAVEEAAGTTAWALRHTEKGRLAPNRVVVCVVSGGNV